MIHYFDASALAKRYVEEEGTGFVLTLLAEGLAATSRYTLVELASALARRSREGDLSPPEGERAFTALLQDGERLLILELTPLVSAFATELLRRCPLRAGDAVDLASCLVLKRRFGGRLRFVCFDERLQQAARAEGLTVLP